MDELVSVIVPVYNVEDYLMRCVDALINQTYKNLEIILVDDGSTDRSGDMCDYYAKEDNRVKVIHQKNAGQSKARNVALDMAKGEYYCFIDSDDYVPTDYIERLYKALIDYDADVALCDFVKFTGESVDGAFDKKEKDKVEIYSESPTLLVERMHTISGELYVVMWGKLFKKKLFDGIRFPEGRICEDLAILYKLFFACKNGVHIDDIMYYYFRDNRNSSTYNINKKFYTDVFLALDEEIEYMQREHKDMVEYPKKTYMYWILDYYRKLYKSGEKTELKQLHKKYKKFYQEISNIQLEKFYRAFYFAPNLYMRLKK